jgi:hypothetical protein
MVSADVVVAEDDETARTLAIPYGVWVHDRADRVRSYELLAKIWGSWRLLVSSR